MKYKFNKTGIGYQVFSKRIILLLIFCLSTGYLQIVAQERSADIWLPNGRVNAVAKKDNILFLGGEFNLVGRQISNLVILDPETAQQNNGNNLPYIKGVISASISDNNGGWYVGGSFEFESKGEFKKGTIIHILANHQIENVIQFEVGNEAYISAMCLSSDTLYFGGSFLTINNMPRQRLASVNIQTKTLTDWNPSIEGGVPKKMIIKNDTVIIGGDFRTYGNGIIADGLIAIHKKTGYYFSWYPLFNELSDGKVSDMVLWNNNLYVCGDFGYIFKSDNTLIYGLAIIDVNTGKVKPQNYLNQNLVNSLLLVENTVYVGGNFETIGGKPIRKLAALDASTGQVKDWSIKTLGDANQAVSKITVSGENLYVSRKLFGSNGWLIGEDFFAVNTKTASFSNWNPKFNKSSNILCASGNKILTGGDFTLMNCIERKNFVAIDAVSLKPLEQNIQLDGTIGSFAIYNDILFIGGGFTKINNVKRMGLAAIQIGTNQLLTWKSGLNGSVSKIKIYNKKMYLNGYFSSLGNVFIVGLDLLTGKVTDIPIQPNCLVNDFEVADDSLLYIGGKFSKVGNENRLFLASINLKTGKPTNWNAGQEVSINTCNQYSEVKDILIIGDTLFSGGYFANIPGIARPSLLAINRRTGQALLNQANISGFNDESVVSKLSFDNHQLFVGGYFEVVGSQTKSRLQKHLASFNFPDLTLTNWKPEPDKAIDQMQSESGLLWVSGEISKIAGVNSSGNMAFGKIKDSKLKKFNTIRGKVYIDNNQNCKPDTVDQSIAQTIVMVEPSNLFSYSDDKGNYQIEVDTGSYTVKEILTNTQTAFYSQTCLPSLGSDVIKFNSYGNVEEKNFGNKVEYFPYLETSISSNRRRRCFNNNTTVSYSNSGLALATDAKVYVKLPEYVIFKSADKPFTKDAAGNYVFSVGTLEANQSGTINIIDSVSCISNISGLTACTKVWITPSNKKAETPGYDKSDIFVSGKCQDNGFLRMGVYNFGSGNMKDSSEYRVFINAELAFKKKFKLPQNDSIIFRIPANGRTVRLEADQPKEHPSKSATNVTIENCGTSPNAFPVKGYVTKLPQDDTEPEVSIQCLPIIDSFDPNDKQVMPEGTTSQHFTPTNAELNYLIRFQNTGTDTAYTVTVIDTLSDNLDIATLQIGASSHKYKFNVSGKGKPVLTWTFNNINLPDSTRNEKASNGFLSFSIKAKENLPLKTKIENFADIIFDFNDPVRTNVTFNTIYDVPADVVQSIKLEEKAIIPLPLITSFSPTKAKTGESITVKGKNFETLLQNNLLKIKDLQAIIQSASDSVIVFKVPQGAISGKLFLKTSYGFTESQTNFEVLNPPILTSFSPAKAKVGETVTLNGKYFEKNTNDNLVKLNGSQVSIQSGNDSTLVFQVPTGASSGKITLQTSIETVTSSTDFIVLYPPAIASFSPETGIPNDKVTISGTGFDVIANNNTVKFGEINAEVVSAKTNELEVKVPSGFYQEKISVETAGGKSTSNKDFTMLLTPLEKLPDNQIKIYPNPTDGKITIDFSENAFKVQEISVLSVVGRSVLEKKIHKNTRIEELDLSGMSAGMYLLLIKTETGLISRKFVLK